MKALLSIGVALSLAGLAPFQLPETKSRMEGPAKVKPGAMVMASVIVEVPSGNHAYAPPAAHDELTVLVTVPAGAKYKLAKIAYPAGKMVKYPGFEEPVLAYEGTVKIPVQVQLPKGAKGKVVVKLQVRTQVCSNTEGACYPPKTETVSANVTVSPK